MGLSDHVQQKGQRLQKEGKVSNLKYGLGCVRADVEGSNTIHVPEIKLEGDMFCGCKGFYFHREPCSHLVALVEAVEAKTTRNKLYNVLEGEEYNMSTANEFITTSIDELNEMLSLSGSAEKGGLPQKTALAISGKPKAGKTILAFQLAYEVMKEEEGYNALLFDTEGSMHTYYGWKETFDTRYGIDTEMIEVDYHIDYIDRDNDKKETKLNVEFEYDRNPEVDNQIFLLDVRELQDILAIHGRPAAVSTENKKMQLEPDGPHIDIMDTAIGKLLKSNNIKYMDYDSITNPLEHFTNRQPDRPTRAKATQWWMTQAQNIAKELDLVQVYITHLSKNPTMQYDRPNETGGLALHYNIKFSVYLRAKKSTRAMKLFRHPTKPEWENENGKDQWFMDLVDGKGYVG